MDNINNKNGKKEPSFLQGLSTVIVLFLSIVVGFTMFKIRIEILLLFTATYAGIIASRLGYNWDELFEFIVEKIRKTLPGLLIIFGVGAIISSWMFAGTVPMIIYYGLKIIKPEIFLVTAFLICTIVSTLTGSSWASAGTAGVALMGVAIGLGISLPAAAGAIISGATFGDKMSPMSDTTIMASLSSGADIYEHIRHMFYTTIPANLLGMVVWGIVGYSGVGQELVLPETVDALMNGLSSLYKWNIVLIIPAVIVLGGAITKKPTLPVMFLASIVAVTIGTFYQGFDPILGLNSMVNGFHVSMITADASGLPASINTLLNRGGMISMADIAIIVFCAMGFAGIAQGSGCLDVILEKMDRKIKTTFGLVFATIVSNIVLVSALGQASVTAVFTGELFQDAYRRKKLAMVNLSRTIEDSATMICPIMPWSGSGIFYLKTLGVSATAYAAWTVPAYTCILFAMLYAATGFGMRKLEPGDEGYPEEENNVSNG